MNSNTFSYTVLFIGSIMCTLLVIGRMSYSGSSYYDFMLWNLILGWIPIVLSQSIKTYYYHHKKSPIILLVILLWLLFLPNAPYMITDFIHLRPRNDVPVSFDAILLTCFSMLGLFQYFFSLFQMEPIIQKHVHLTPKWVTLSLLFITSIGIALGRILRWNSWDILFPIKLFLDLTNILSSWDMVMKLISLTSVFFILLVITHYVARRLLRFEHKNK